ncbi:MAG: diaminopimelate dehydrogenase [Oscillospiraceae bacterium]|nr:diaminopimelate dehydrogenase [Oscillospiraceae bacterium]
MKKIAIVGAGNVGISAAKAVMDSPDMELCGFIRRKEKAVPGFEKIPVAESVFDFSKKPDGAIICVPSKSVEPIEAKLLENGIYSVDAFDIHEELSPMKKRLSESAKIGNVSAVIGAGWDPGIDSIVRTLISAVIPEGKMFTNFGPGMSMGHTAAAKAVFGVADAVSVTIPAGNGKHTRKIYAVLEKNADKNAVEHGILSDGYFEHDECSVEFVDSVKPFFNTRHAVFIDAADGTHKLSFRMENDNPIMTGRMLVSAMRAAFLQKPGAYFMTEIPPCNFCAENCEKYL